MHRALREPGCADKPFEKETTLITPRAFKSVKLILPALTEATSPYWRPIKYSLFPPLGLATLAAYLDPDLEISLQDEHVEKAGPQ